MAVSKLKQQTEDNLKKLKEELKTKKEKTISKPAEEEVKPKTIESIPQQTFRNNLTEVVRPLGSESSSAQNQSQLEMNLANEPLSIQKPEQLEKKPEELYQEAKLLYENRESQRQIQSGREPIRAQRIAINALPTGNNASVGVMPAQMINPLLDANRGGEETYKAKLLDTSRSTKMPWEVDEERIKKYR